MDHHNTPSPPSLAIMDPEVFRYIFHHVVFPPKLPGEPEREQKRLESGMIKFVKDTLVSFVEERPPDIQDKWEPVANMLELWLSVDAGADDLNRHQDLLVRHIKDLKINGAVALYVCAQNCGWLAHYDSARDNVIIDAFEVTATSAAILKATGALIRCFPGQSVAIPASMINQTAFCKYLAHNLCRLNLESVREMCPKATQSRDCIEEIRDTVNPGLVTEGLMAQLLAFGEHNVWKSFEKHMRDDVIYEDTKLPWRRSPLWFVIKVALQTVLYRIFPDNEGYAEYKNFMLYLSVKIGKEAESLELANIADILAIIRAKVARRTYKLQGKVFETVMKRVMETDEAILQHLQRRRARIQTPESTTISHSFGPLQECDLETSLKNSRDYIDNAMKSRAPDKRSSTFNKEHKTRKKRQTTGLPKLEDDDILSLLDFEAWVETELQEWHANTSPTDKVCCDLADLIEKYSEFASKKYAQMRDASSLMLLVLLELWVALDSLCVRFCPILKEYSPGLSKKLVEPLLLPLFHQMQRARQVEDYIRSRKPHGSSYKSIFSDPGPDTFAVRYVDKTRKHRKVLEMIEKLATQEREALRIEWGKQSKKYQDLISEASNLTHDSDLDEWDNETHSTSCHKCSLETEAQKLNIQVHEWPLLRDEDKAKNVVFELVCPHWFAKWRDITWKIVDDYGRPQTRVPSRMEMNILEYPATQSFAAKWGQRLTLASSTKSWLNTHYKTQRFPVTFNTIAVSNPFNLSLWDTEREVWVAGRFKLQKYPTFNHLCTLTLNDPKYSGLQYAVESCQHNQNKVLADQRNCHPKITLQEMSAFGHLRAGERLQWYNITRELVSLSFSMNESSVHKLLCQAAWELGSHVSGTQLGEAHVFFEELTSVNRLLESLEHRLSIISANWNEHYTLHTVVILGARVLSLCPTSAVERASSFLRRCRKVAIDWCTRIKTALDAKIGAGNDSRLSLLFRIGGICLLTFSVEDRLLARVLESEEDLQFLLRSSIVLFDNTPQPIESQSLETRALVLHGTRILCNAEKQVSQLIIKHPSALNVAIQQVTNHVQISSPWCFAPGDNQRWATNKSLLTADGDTQEAHYNILSGELLINNERPKRLPEEYTRHPLFQRHFGAQTISVVSCRRKGTRFASTQRFGNTIVYFLLEGDQLVVKTMADHTLRLIPHDVLAEDFPDSLITKFAHWLDLNTGEIEFRPLDQVWEPNPKNWRTFYKHQNGEIPRTRQGQRVLIDVHSGLFAQISNVLSRLDHLKHIQITSTQDSRIEAKLVRLHLSFFVNADGALECREHNAIVDQNQDIGCLSNLFSKLVLRGKTGQRHRTVLVPYGTVRISKEALYSQVSIDPLCGSRVKYFHYFFDRSLGMLSDTSGMVGALYQAYLHAVTTYVLPDAATNRSGTEEALRILRQARMKSSFPLDGDCIHLLELIASLTPRRQYHPPGMKVMQRVIWNPQIGELAQHDDFRVITQDIFNHTAKFAALHSSKKELPSGLDRGDIHLLDRARLHHSRFHRPEFSNNSTGLDMKSSENFMPSEYIARDRGDCVSDRSRRVYEIAALIRDWPSNASQKEAFFDTVKGWGNIYMKILTPDQHTYTSLMESQIQHLWGSLYSQCRSRNRESGTYELISVFCTIAFGNSVPTLQLRHLLTIAFAGYFPEIPQKLLQGPVQLGLAPGQDIDRSKVKDEIANNYPPQKPNPRGSMKNLSGTEKETKRSERRKKYQTMKKQEIEALASQISRQWPCEVLQRPTNMEPWKVKSMNACDILFKKFNRDVQFHQFIEFVQQKLDAVPTSPLPDLPTIPPALPQCRPLICARSNPWQAPSLQDMLHSSNAPSPMDIDQTPFRCQRPQMPASSDRGPIDNLQSLISGLRKSTKSLRRQYAHTLSDSLGALIKVRLPCASAGLPIERDILVQHHKRAIEQRDILWGQIVLALTTVDSSWKAIGSAVFRPSINVLSILSFLAADKWDSVPPSWKNILVMFAKAIVSLRRYERLLGHFDNEDVNTFYKEAETVGCEGWEASRIPDWLLLEVEGNMTIRKRQANVAQRMIAPESNENCVLQLNMGEGKTTIITPMIAAYLANVAQMVRIVVLKPLLRQSINLLSQRLGGLLNRPIYYVPFSRNTRIDRNTIETLQATYSECQRNRGILIALPEQLLSFRLVGLDLAPSDNALGLVDIEQSLQDSCRTIIDESDEILDPKFQLIYTRGNQQNVDGESDRWGIIQYVLELVAKQVGALQSEDQKSLHIEQRDIRYPLIHFLSEGAPDHLLQGVTKAISRGELPGVSFTEWADSTQKSVLNFITLLETNDADERVVRNTFKDSIVLKKLLVLRGLFAHGILRFVLASKRWLVDYGLHPSRCLSAVPFRAKGVPSENSEFGHADVALVLTYLSYYYEGLTEEQVRQCFYFLMKENDPGAEYQRWITRNRDGLPEGLHSFNGVNLEDDHTFQGTLYQHLQYQKGIIDFFLAKIVFPKEAKGFPFKLSLSAWDIPSKPPGPLTTGFSGTNDNRYLLPKSMPQKDLPYLLHTNAMVLSQLLHEDNKQCILAEDKDGRQLPVNGLLHLINDQDPHIKVIIDVGALILETSNEEVARTWLSLVRADRARAAIYFDANDEAMVVDREGYIERLIASPFYDRLHLCLLFLDQHHARGVDIKLPRTYRAAVTLGPRLTKDRLVQACNRMRELGNGQSVVFFIPPEVRHSMKKNDAVITSIDVVQWVLEQTCDQLEKLQPLWAWQGLQHFRCAQIWDEFRTRASSLGDIVVRIQEPESKSLSQLYAPWGEHPGSIASLRELALHDPTVRELLEKWEGVASTQTVLYEEQERELTQEIQREPQIRRPPSVEARNHTVHADIKHFVTHGQFPNWLSSEATEPAFKKCLSRTSARAFELPSTVGPGIHVSLDFLDTIKQDGNTVDDEFLKPVHWVLSSTRNRMLIIISQHEANYLLPSIRKSKRVTLHMYAPRTAKDMCSFNKLDFLTVGQSLPNLQTQISPEAIRDLEIFSGSLYFDTYAEYQSACQFFGFKTGNILGIPQDAITSEGFVSKEARTQAQWPIHCPFTTSPLTFLRAWYSIRTKGQGFSRSHIGSIVEARRLTEDRF